MTCVLRTSRQWGELAVQSNHSFLLGASHPEELEREAARLGHAGIALTDGETVGGAVRAQQRVRVRGDQPVEDRRVCHVHGVGVVAPAPADAPKKAKAPRKPRSPKAR
jgi:error-prone DNA polymerase